MKNYIVIFFALLFINRISAQDTSNTYDEKLAKSLGADEYGMKQYVFCILKKGSNTTATKEERSKFFEGHMTNITRLASEGKLVVAGPFLENDKNYSGLFIFNVSTVEEALKLVESDPAVKAKIFEFELTPWYSSAALQEIAKLHDKIAKVKI